MLKLKSYLIAGILGLTSCLNTSFGLSSEERNPFDYDWVRELKLLLSFHTILCAISMIGHNDQMDDSPENLSELKVVLDKVKIIADLIKLSKKECTHTASTKSIEDTLLLAENLINKLAIGNCFSHNGICIIYTPLETERTGEKLFGEAWLDHDYCENYYTYFKQFSYKEMLGEISEALDTVSRSYLKLKGL